MMHSRTCLHRASTRFLRSPSSRTHTIIIVSKLTNILIFFAVSWHITIDAHLRIHHHHHHWWWARTESRTRLTNYHFIFIIFFVFLFFFVVSFLLRIVNHAHCTYRQAACTHHMHSTHTTRRQQLNKNSNQNNNNNIVYSIWHQCIQFPIQLIG